jgi:23S rRNA (uracil1939-C5)-methyltransferase
MTATGLRRGPTDRAPPVVCEHSARCGGCPLIDHPYDEQLALKRQRVVDAFARYPGLRSIETEPVAAAAPVVGYRTRAKLIVGPGGELGLYARGGDHQVVDIPGCRVLAPVLTQVAAGLRARIAAARDAGPLAPARPDGPGALRAVDLREVSDGEAPPAVLVTLVFERGRSPAREALEAAGAELVSTLASVVGVAANFQERSATQVLGGETVRLAGVASAPDRIGASTHLATYGSFVQAHRGQAGRIHAAVAEAVASAGPRPKVLDLYGGSGAIALGLAAAGARVVLVESFAPAVAQARAAAERQGLTLRAACADAAREIEELAGKHETFDAAVLNPPRRGASPEVRVGLARLAPGVIAYVSCDPETLARDLDHFARLGYGASSVRPFDMIPLTDEVEVVAVLRRGPLPPPRILYEDDDVLVVEKGAHEPTTSRGPEEALAASLVARVRTLPGAGQSQPVNRLETEASGLVVFVRQADQLASWTRALAAPTARAEHVVGVRGVIRAKGTVARPLHDRGRTYPARTTYRRVAVVAGHSLLRATPEPGRAHQIRRHMAAIGHPVLGDERYGDPATNRHFAEKYGLDRSLSHLARLELDHPRTGARLVVECPIAGDLASVLERASGAAGPVTTAV